MFSTNRLFRLSLVSGLVACVNGGASTAEKRYCHAEANKYDFQTLLPLARTFH